MSRPAALKLRSFSLRLAREEHLAAGNIEVSTDAETFTLSSPGGGFSLRCSPRRPVAAAELEAAVAAGRLRLSTGDMTDRAGAGLDDLASGNSAHLEVDFSSGSLTLQASLAGLPPIFYQGGPQETLVVSDLILLRDHLAQSLTFDRQAVVELATIGYPIGGKTLFRDVRMLAAGHRLVRDEDGSWRTERYWSLPAGTAATWEEFIEEQKEAFQEAMAEIVLDDSFLSLTAGMDTRAILAALAARRTLIPAYTMSGPTLALDARIAGRLCRAYGADHTTIHLDQAFLADLPRLCGEASRLSGGLTSLGQAHEVFFYSRVAPHHRARLSGNLGNQVGRGGAENISLRNAGLETLSNSLRPAAAAEGLQHWYAPYLRGGGQLGLDFLLAQEIPFSSVGNYCIGNRFATQQTPYAGRKLIEVSGRRPQTQGGADEPSLVAMRLKDLRHRFLGEPAATSFQRRLIAETGGPVAEIPINWGGKAGGGISPGGVCRGLTALADALLAAKNIHDGPLYRTAALFGVAGVHEYRPCSKWLRGELREFAADLFADAATRECGLFAGPALENAAQAYFKGREELYPAIVLSLDLALAAREFKAGL